MLIALFVRASLSTSYATKADAVLDSLQLDSSGKWYALFPGRWKSSNTLVISCQPMNSRFNQNETELRIFILTISLQMFSHCNSLIQ
jgi:hypothetical protein